MDEKLEEFRKYLESELAFVRRYLKTSDISLYHAGREDALIGVLTEFNIIFEEKENDNEGL